MSNENKINQLNQLVDLNLENEKQLLAHRNEIKTLQREKDEEKRKFLISVIEMVDAFERKEENLHKKHEEADAKKIIKNFAIVKKRMLNVLNDNDVSEVELKHFEIDSSVVMIVDTVKDESNRNDYIAEVLKKGYKIGGNILRQAEIILVKNE
ncbi:nucleotide exchange factor GrpE [Saccharicrinis sp. 156]|uniref:nucleotide exchange factor GrpE n=1 Tax=Saccharicrinis sp. 156 TaxID=3417574 RepID=UPI003D34FEDA